MKAIAVLAVLVMVAPPVWAEPQGGFATPPPSVLEKLRDDQKIYPWLRITTDSAQWEVKARVIDDYGLSGLTIRRSAPPPFDLISWSSISRIDAGGSRLTNAAIGALAGALILGGVGGAAAAAAEEEDSWDQVMAGLSGGLVFGLIGVGVGGLVGVAFPPWHKVYQATVSVPRP